MTRRRVHGEGSITKRADGRYQVRIDLGRDALGKRQRMYRYADTPEEAARLLRRLARDKEDKRIALSKSGLPRTFGAWLDMWLEMVKTSREPKTYERYESIVRIHVAPALGHIALDDMHPFTVQRFLDAKLQAGVKANTVRVMWAVITGALTRAERLGGPANVATRRSIEVPGAEAAPENILTLAEARAFLATIHSDRLYALWMTALVLGQRKSSLLALRWADIDEGYTRMKLPMKLIRYEHGWQLRPVSASRTKKAPRSLPIPAPLAVALREHRALQQREREAAGSEWYALEYEGREVELVFTGKTGRPLFGQHVITKFQALLMEAGLDKRRFHDLRHSAASVMLALGIPLKTVSEVLAHCGIQITADLYGHLEDDLLREQLRVLDTAWAEEGAKG